MATGFTTAFLGDGRTLREFISSLVQAFHHYTKNRIIAEEIETDDEFRTAKETGVYLIQGFRFGKPTVIATLPTFRRAVVVQAPDGPLSLRSSGMGARSIP
ncbi:MAG: hypothetical protein ACOYXR_03975 [Nitrospirota bacterium]